MEEIVKDESSIKYCGIRVDANNIKLIEEKAVARIIPKEKISQINIIKGSAAKRPWVAILIAMALIIMGSVPIPSIIRFLSDGEPMSRIALFLPVWIFLGLIILFETVPKQFIFQICTDKGEERLRFQSKVEKQQLEEFLRLVNSQYGYNVHSLTDEISL